MCYQDNQQHSITKRAARGEGIENASLKHLLEIVVKALDQLRVLLKSPAQGCIDAILRICDKTFLVFVILDYIFCIYIHFKDLLTFGMVQLY